ncbi:MAG: hypothetical protein QUT30_04980 [Acidobacteriota bacterium]|nr:hypothetical protein [Acidobacteriota bacterium]
MFKEIHDSLLVGYSVSSKDEQQVLYIEPHRESAPAPFTVIFDGVAAHFFIAPLLPAVLLDIELVSADLLINDEWASMEKGYHQCGWPGPWADSLDHAFQHAASAAFKGFYIDSSYGLSGWVLVRSVRRGISA